MASKPDKRGGGAPRLQIIHLGTGNAHKVAEFQRLADESGLPVRIVPAALGADAGWIGAARLALSFSTR